MTAWGRARPRAKVSGASSPGHSLGPTSLPEVSLSVYLPSLNPRMPLTSCPPRPSSRTPPQGFPQLRLSRDLGEVAWCSFLTHSGSPTL